MKTLRNLVLFAALAIAAALPAGAQQSTQQVLCNAVTTAAACDPYQPNGLYRTFQASGQTTAGAGSFVINVEVSDEPTPGANDWIVMCTITLTLSTTKATNGCSSVVPWLHVRGNPTTVSGTGASGSLRYVGR